MLTDLSFLKRIQLGYLGLVYGFTYQSGRLRFLGASLRGWIKLLAWASLLATWIWAREFWPLTAVFVLYIHAAYWHSKRAHYVKFVPLKGRAADGFSAEIENPLPPNERVPMQATGIFSTAHEENLELLRPAYYWHVPLGEHVIMVEHMPNKFRYQFFTARALQQVQQGALLHGRTPRPTLAVTYLATWRPQVVNYAIPNAAPEEGSPSRMIYFTFETPEEERRVLHAIVHDARRIRS